MPIAAMGGIADAANSMLAAVSTGRRFLAFPMLRLLVLLTALWLPPLAAAQPLLSPDELSARLNDPALRVVDVRAAPAREKSSYASGHIPGALAAPYGKWRGPAANPGALPDKAALQALIRSLGIDAATPVVVVFEGADATEFGAAARVYWTLKAAGLTRLSILDGGMAAWRVAGKPVTADVHTVAPSQFDVVWNPQVIASREEVQQAAAQQSEQLLDARPPAYFAGETRHPAARAPGTLAGAQNVPHDLWFIGDSTRLQSMPDARRVAAEQGIAADRPTVSFCNTGHWAATNWFVLSEVLGQKDVKLYPESMVGWSQAGLPMDHVPGRLQQFWLQLREAVGAL